MSNETKETTVKKDDMKTVYATEKSSHMKKNTPYEVHSVLADKLIEKGTAISEADYEKSKKSSDKKDDGKK